MLGERYKVYGALDGSAHYRCYLAEDLESGGSVAIQILSDWDPDGERGARERFEQLVREVTLRTALSHPNLQEVLGIGETSSGLPYLVTEALVGEPLDRALSGVGRLPLDAALVLVRQAATGLSAMHAANLVHGALRPSNLQLLGDVNEPAGVKVLDDSALGRFARTADQTAKFTVEQLAYSAPELFLDSQAEQSSDVFSLGVLLFRLLTGALPFEGEAGTRLLWHQLVTPLPSPRDAGVELDPRLCAIISNCTRKRPENRYGAVSELLEDLNAVLGLSSKDVGTRRLSLSPDAYPPRSDAGVARFDAVRRESTRGADIATRRESSVESHFGIDVPDPYRWLERATEPEVRAWIAAQNAATEDTLRKVAERDSLRRELSELLATGSLSTPTLRRLPNGDVRLFYTRRSGEQQQPVLYVRDGIQGEDRELLDPTKEAGGENTTALDWYEPSPDGALLAYGISRDGSEDSTLAIRHVDSGVRLPDSIARTQHVSLSWRPDSRGFFYTRYPEPHSVPRGEERLHRRVFEHELGQAPREDPLVFGRDLSPADFPGLSSSPNGRWLLVSVSRGWSETQLFLADLSASSREFKALSLGGPARNLAVVLDDVLYVLTNADAERCRLLALDPAQPDEPARLVVAEHEQDVLQSFEVLAHDLVLSYLSGGIARLARVGHDGSPRPEVALPMLGTAWGLSGLPDGDDLFYAFESFTVAPQVRHLNAASGEQRTWQQVSAPPLGSDYVIELAEALSKDGTRIPYQQVYRRTPSAQRAGPRPTLLYGYGGFNESIQPRFSRSLPVWLERGHVYVQALVRGGGEFGEAWHRAGQKESKQNSFDDFIAVAEDLIARDVSSPSQLSILGRSNGGLLVAAAITQRPALFAAAVAGVPLTDMLRYPRFLIGKLWEPEYGSPEREAEFRALHAYSPYHRVKAGTAYPAVLVTTGESDTRVDPLHARKWVAALQHAQSAARPILLRTEHSGGHGAGTSVRQQVAELTDMYAFLLSEGAP